MNSNVPDPVVSRDFLAVWNLLDVAYAYFGREKSAEQVKQTLRLYAQMLGDIPLDLLKQAVLRHINTSKYFPTVAELREAVGTLAQPVQQTALEAWGEVMAAMSDTRYYVYTDHCTVPEFANPITNKLVASMGWRILSQSENNIADRARFTQAYEQLVERERRESPLPDQLRAGAAHEQLPAPQVDNVKRLPGNVADVTAALVRARRIA